MDLHKGMYGIKKDEVERHTRRIWLYRTDMASSTINFWGNEEQGTFFCLIEGPSKETCTACHAEAHGNLACEIIEVHPTDIATFMGNSKLIQLCISKMKFVRYTLSSC